LINISAFTSFELDINKLTEIPKLYICKPNKQIVSILDSYFDFNYNPKLSQIDELSFSILTDIEIDHQLIRNENFDLIKYKYLILLDFMSQRKYFVINTVESNSEENSYSKKVTCYSLEYNLSDEIINYSNEETDYSKNCTEIATILLENTIWTIGTISASLDLKYLQFSFSEQTCIDCLFSVATSFSALVFFDTENYTVSFLDDLTSEENIENIYNSTNYPLVLDYGKYIQNLTYSPNPDTFCTHLRVLGANDLTINSVNITGGDELVDYYFFMHPFSRLEDGTIVSHSDYMSDELCISIENFQSKISTYEGQYATLTDNKIALQEQVNSKNTELSNLNIEMLVILDSLDIAQSNGQDTDDLIWQRNTKQEYIDNKKKEIYSLLFNITIDTPCTSSGNILLYLNDITMNIPLISGDNTTAIALKICDYINNRYYNYDNKFPLNSTFKAIYNGNNIINVIHYTTEIGNALFSYIDDTDSTGVTGTFTDNVNNGLENQIADIDSQMLAISNDLAMENNFSDDNIFELKQSYIKKRQIRNDSISNPKILLEYGKSQFKKYYSIPISLDIDLVDMYNCLDVGCQIDRYHIKVGEIIRCKYDKFSIDVKAIITEIDYSYDNGSVTIVINNIADISKDKDKFLALLNKNISTTIEFNNLKTDFNSINGTNNQVANIIETLQGKYTGELNLASNEYCSLDRRGLTATDPNDPKRILRLTHGILGLSKTGGDNFETCISADGIVAEKLIGEIILGNSLTIDASDAEGVQYFTVNQNGFQIMNMILSLLRSDNKSRIIINPTVGFSIQQNKATPPAEDWINVITIDNNGVINLRELKLNNTEGNTVLDISGENNIINFSNFITKNGVIEAENLKLNGMDIEDELGNIWTSINEYGQLAITASNNVKSITPDGIISSHVDCDYPNKYSNSGGENHDPVTLRPLYHSGGAVSFESAYDNTVSIKISPSQEIHQINEESTNSGLANPDWWGGRDSRFSFKMKGGTVGVNSLKVSILKFSDNTPLTIVDDSGEEEVSDTFIYYQGVSDWDIGSSKSFYFLNPLPTGFIYVKYENVSANDIYIDQMMIKPKFGKYPGIFQSGPYSFPTSSFAISEYQEYVTSDYSSIGIEVILQNRYLDCTVNGMPWTTSDDPNELNGQPIYFHGKFEKQNIGGLDYFYKLILTPIGTVPTTLTNGKIHVAIIGNGVKLI